MSMSPSAACVLACAGRTRTGTVVDSARGPAAAADVPPAATAARRPRPAQHPADHQRRPARGRHAVDAVHPPSDHAPGRRGDRLHQPTPAVLPGAGRDPHRRVRAEQRGPSQRRPVRRVAGLRRERQRRRPPGALARSVPGYQTGFVGKMLNGYGLGLRRRCRASTTGIRPSADLRLLRHHVLRRRRPGPLPRRLRRRRRLRLHPRLPAATSRVGRRPWFLWVSHVGPHTSNAADGTQQPADPGRAARPLFRRRRCRPASSATSFNEADVSDKPPEVSDRSRATRRASRRLFRARIRSLQSIDEANRAAVRQLRRSGELDNTVVIYTSDNGYLLGEHRLEGKNYPYEESLRVPFSVRGPGLPAGTTVADRLTMVDLAPTFLAWAGALDEVGASGHTDGIDMTPVLRARSGAEDPPDPGRHRRPGGARRATAGGGAASPPPDGPSRTGTTAARSCTTGPRGPLAAGQPRPRIQPLPPACSTSCATGLDAPVHVRRP